MGISIIKIGIANLVVSLWKRDLLDGQKHIQSFSDKE